MKTTTVLILTALFVCTLIGVVVYDQKPVAGNEQRIYEDLNDVAEINQEGEANQILNSETILTNAQTSNSVSEKTQRRRVPLPYEKGVVHLGVGASLGGKLPFPEDNAWNQRIDKKPVDPMSRTLISSIGITKHLHPDFGSGTWEGAPIGIPYVVVSGDQPRVPIVYTAYGDESDPGPYPIPDYARIEGAPNQDGDRHVIVIDRDEWKLYEIFRAFSIADGELWRADSGAIFGLSEHPSRPIGWTSADAAGLPIFPGLVRYDEVVEQKEIRHALRFTVNNTRRAFVAPATHWASRSNDPRLPPLGMRVRLKADYDISDFPAETQVILTALKKYGMILADNGSDWYISGSPDPRWDNDSIHALKKVTGKDLEVVLMENIVTE
ncbi:MAG: hypothetical protein HON04_13115 [Planctomicrobium sp.]|jgi:hypothetical protein|nr:hypothetical protein [Planctomicrobium sp.]